MSALKISFALLAMLLLLLTGCRKENYPELPSPPDCLQQLSIDTAYVLQVGGHPLQFSLHFNTSRAGMAHVEYGPVGGASVLHAADGVNDAFEVHLPMLRDSTQYFAIAHAVAGNCTAQSDTVYFTTGSLPSFLPLHDLITADIGFPEGMFILSNQSSVPNFLCVLDESCRVVWYHYPDKACLTFNWTDRGTILMALVGDEIREINLLGETVWTYTLPAGGRHDQPHHDVLLDSQGRYVALTRVDSIFDLTSQGGGPADLVVGDGIVVVDNMGNIMWDWSILDHLDPRTDTAIATTHADWGHANSVFETPDGDYLVSFRNFNQIWKLDGTTGAIIWKLGDGGDFPLPTEAHFIRQHHAHLNSNGDLMLFDNGGGSRLYSRALAFALDEGGKTATVTIDAKLPASLYSSKMGGAYLLGDGNILMNSTDARAIVITDQSGNVRWLAQNGYGSYKAMPFYPLKPVEMP